MNDPIGRSLDPIKRAALLARLRERNGERAGTAPTIERIERGAPLPVSWAQQRLWFLDQLDAAAGAAYHMHEGFRIRGALDPQVLKAALDRVVQRQEVLRTTFERINGEPKQIIGPDSAGFPLIEVDLSGLDELAREAALARHYDDEARHPFDLSRGPLARGRLLRLSDNEHVLLIVKHHIVSDGWSVGLLMNEVSALYGAFAKGAADPLPPLRVQYADYAAWQRRWLTADRLQRQATYWRQQLHGAPPLLELPTDRPRPPVQTYAGAGVPVKLGAELVQGLRALSQRAGTTLFMTLLAAWGTLLWRVSGQDDLVIGTAVANRGHSDVEGVIGFFVNTLALRLRMDDPTVAGLLAQVKATTLGAYEHQDMPFDQVVETLQPARSLSHSPVAQVMLGLRNTPRGQGPLLPGLEVSSVEVPSTTTHFDLSMNLIENDETVTGQLDYASDLFDAPTMARLVENWRTLLAAFARAGDDDSVAGLPLMDEAQRHQVLEVFGHQPGDVDEEALLHRLFEFRVRDDGDAVALIFEGTCTTYRDLDKAAGRIAHRLADLGVQPGERVAVSAARGPVLVAALLGVLKSGAAFVPLDPTYPRERLDFMLDDARPRALLTQSGATDELFPHAAAPSVALPATVAEILQRFPDRELHSGDRPVTPEYACYVTYTSGSTGQPKGVLNPHRGVCNLVQVSTSFFGVTADSRILQFASPSFDSFMWEVGTALAAGATLYLAAADDVRPGPPLAQTLATGRITHALLPPSALAAIPADGDYPALRVVLTGSEVLPPAIARAWSRRRPLFNNYGPTECATFAISFRCDGLTTDTVPIGRPLGLSRVYLLNEHRQPVPIGTPGEIYIGGRQVSLGYFDRPELTTERFLPNPFHGGLMYRTGDMARWMPDGNIEFIGRNDFQVKLRGFRVEPGEIEARLSHHPEVQEAVVVMRQDAAGDKRLVCYVIPRLEDGEAAAGIAREHVTGWSHLFSQTYRSDRTDWAAGFNHVGWNSSYTRQPIPEAHMQEWLGSTLRSVNDLHPRRVLEVGCGTGMILFNVAPGCEAYDAIEIGEDTVTHLNGAIAAHPALAGRARVFHGHANDLGALPGGVGYDTVLMNSVVQYFPSLDYLRDAIAGALALVPGQGRIFVGDVRNHALLEEFHLTVQLFQADEALPSDRLLAQAYKRAASESELLVEPAWFLTLPARFPQITAVTLCPKETVLDNEMSTFRFDVVLEIRGQAATGQAIDWRAFEADDGLDGMARHVAGSTSPVVVFRGVRQPHQHAAEDVLGALRDRSYQGRAGGLSALLRERSQRGVSTGQLAQWCREHQYGLRLRFATDIDLKGVVYDAAILKDPQAAAGWQWPATESPAELQRTVFANDPLRTKWSAGLPERLRAYLGERLPEYMVPGAFVALPEFPRTPNGKLDREALPVPEVTDVVTRQYEAPQPGLESDIAALWRELLGLQRVGRHDNFFELGGHSLRAVQFISRLQQAHGVEVPLKELFAAPVLQAFVERARHADAAGQPPVLPRADVALLPVSWAQRRLWFLAQLDEAASVAYHMSEGLSLEGRLDHDVLRRALDRIVARHEALRTVFDEVAGEPVQVIVPPDVGFSLSIADLRELAPAEQAREVASQRAAEARQPFDLRRGPLARGRLLQLADDRHLLFLTQHHIISDGWSTSLLVGEISALYTAFTRGEADPLALPPVQYPDYALWQRQWLDEARLEAQASYWRDHLAGAPALLELPTDRPRPAVQSWRGRKVKVHIPPELAGDLRALSRRHEATLFMTMLAAWSALMYRQSGQSDVVIGTVVANRQRVELESVMGFFVNTLALRVQIDGEADIGSLLRQVKSATLGGYAHQDLPFEKVVEAVKPPRSLSHGPLFQVMFAFENLPTRSQLDLPGMQLRSIDTDHVGTQFDLALSLNDRGEAVEGQLEYASDLFDADTIERLVGQYLILLRAVASGSLEPVDRLPLLTEAQRRTLLLDFNDTATDTPRQGRLVHQLFEAQAAARPDAIALVFDEVQLSYSDLNRRANQVAHRLIALGVRPDDRVAICVERSPEMVIGLLGILKASGAYVPLEPSYPAERLAYMLADSAPSAVVTTQAFDALVALDAVPRLLLDGPDGDVLAGQATSNPDPSASGLTATHLAYVLYTSGSTGKPKGAMNQHDGVVNRIVWAQKQYVFEHDDRILQKTPFSFDVSAWEFFWTLGVGATLVMARPGGHQDLHYLADMVDSRGITTIHFVSSMLPMFLELATPGRFGSLRRVIVGGEILSYAMQQRFEQCLPAVELHNQYGPTEAAIDVTYWRCRSDLHPGLVPIGRPIDNTRLYILDRHMEPVPIGVKGELFIGGVQVGRGYLNRDELTRERFIPDVFDPRGGARLYRTGDLARWLPDGSIDFIGRNDFQVKIRGFRIELGEIEARLTDLDEVREAVVIAREDVPGDQRLAAYVVLQEGAQATPAVLRERLAVSLADYMVPSAYVLLPRLPLTANGKLDRGHLPVPAVDALVSRAYVAPEGALECAIADIWVSLLRVDRVSRFDDFFQLGGHSLLAVQFVARLRQAQGVELALRDLFAYTTLDRLAARAAVAVPSELQAITRRAHGQRVPLSLAQRRLWILAQLGDDVSGAYHMPAGLELKGELDESALRRALNRIVARHESLRTVFAAVDAEAVQVIADEGIGFDLAFHDLSALPPGERTARAEAHNVEEGTAPFDLERGPLVRGRLLRLAPDHHLLFITQHHIVSDGWSVGLLIHELSTLYAAFARGLDDPLPPLAIQYADYAVWQREWIGADRLQKQAAYWRQHLRGAPALLELPTDRPRPASQSHRGDTLPFVLPADLAASVRALAQQHGGTMFMTLFAAWGLLLGRLSGQQDVVIGTSTANRTQAETEGIIGFFVNTLALRLRLDAAPTVGELLAQVRQTTLLAYDHQDLPFEQVVEAVQPTRSLSYNPLFQANLILENVPTRQDLALPGLVLSPAPSHELSTQFDVALHLRDGFDDGHLEGDFHFATDLFDRSTIERLSKHYLNLLGALVRADAAASCAALPLVDEDERLQVVETFNRRAASPVPPEPLHVQFERQARLRADAIALVHEDTSLSYRHLNEQANRLAHRLIELGVRPDDRVALCTPRGFDMVIGMLGIWKAGAAYVPLDPDYPAERLQFMLTDSRPMALVSVRSSIADLHSGDLPVVLLDDGPNLAHLEAQASHDPDLTARGLSTDHLAYVIYTSGSTGRPKGAQVTHRSVLNLWRGLEDTVFAGMGAEVIVGWNAAMSFDASVQALVQLLSGRRVVLIPQDIRADADALVAYLSKHRVEVFDCTPTQLEFVHRAGLIRAGGFQPRAILVGGEAISRDLWTQLTVKGGPRCFNLYGPTECTVDATVGEILPGDERPHIGHPMPNVRVYILDPLGQPQPVGVTGEIFIGGEGVSRGYLGRDDLTSERFLPDPFAPAADARMYRSGDLARWLPDGRIEYVGRNDFQVKLRGFRIELGEIETVLRQGENVRDAAVLVREDTPGDKRLVAYVTPTDAGAPEPANLRQVLAREVPEYMVPTAFVVLPELPRTANGKLDRAALPAPDQNAVITRAYESPIGPTENAVADIWKALLNLERVGRHDDFFALGGYSLTAIQVVARIRKALGVSLPLGKLFSQPTVAGLAELVHLEQVARFESSEVDRLAAEIGSLSEEELRALLAQEQT